VTQADISSESSSIVANPQLSKSFSTVRVSDLPSQSHTALLCQFRSAKLRAISLAAFAPISDGSPSHWSTTRYHAIADSSPLRETSFVSVTILAPVYGLKPIRGIPPIKCTGPKPAILLAEEQWQRSALSCPLPPWERATRLFNAEDRERGTLRTLSGSRVPLSRPSALRFLRCPLPRGERANMAGAGASTKIHHALIYAALSR